jgi:HPt (histidine-containing phosphotransfer) domain-containing protein
MNAFIPKPIDPRQLNRSLGDWLPCEKYTVSQDVVTAAVHHGERRSVETLNKANGLAHFQGDVKLYQTILKNFRQDHAGDSDKLRAYMEEGKTFDATRIAHTLKSTSASIGAEKLQRYAFSVEKALQEGREPDVSDIIDMKHELANVIAFIDEDAALETAKKEENIHDGNGSIDTAGAASLVERIYPLLDTGNAEVLDELDDIRRIFIPLGGDYAKAAAAIENLDFTSAATILKEMRDKEDDK